jgi:hypothetical protein
MWGSVPSRLSSVSGQNEAEFHIKPLADGVAAFVVLTLGLHALQPLRTTLNDDPLQLLLAHELKDPQAPWASGAQPARPAC